jgi:SAM-dependent methyltransferase
MFERLRTKIRNGIYQNSSFMQMIAEHTGYNLNDANGAHQIGYNNLDVFLNGLLALDPLPDAILDREPEMVFYQKTPAKIIFELATLAQLSSDDIFIDLGSGLGQVIILMNLLSGTHSVGIEYEPAYHQYAQACAQQLNLANVEFINLDARKGDYSKATVFFLYTPFEGNMLNDMMDILKKQAQQRNIRIFTYGPCSPKIALKNWLTCVNGNAGSEYKLYQFKSLKDTL